MVSAAVLYAVVLAAAAVSTCTFRPQVQLVTAVSHVRVVHDARSYRASANITFTVRTIRKPALSSDPGLQAHIAGYYTIAQRLAEPSQVRAIGTTAAQARIRFLKAVAQLAHDVNLEYARQTRVYDAVTENGRAQNQGPAYSFPGGPDANAYCPQ
jgi:F420-0:gamma-glutamyl ligase-like protein